MRAREALALKLGKAVAALKNKHQSGKIGLADWLNSRNCPAI
jgi:hypothetical protein